MKYRRLVKMLLQLGLLCAVSAFVLRYLWDYGLSTEGMTADILLERGLYALKKGMLVGGLYIGLPVWLALEKFGPGKGTKVYDRAVDGS